MINVYNQVPSVYVNASRDFQYLSWLVNIVLNSVKHNVDDMYDLPNSKADPRLTELLAMTLGFNVKRNYDAKQLIALTAVLPSILRYKGTAKAVLVAAEALVKAVGSHGEVFVRAKSPEVEIILPKDLTDITLFLDLLDYILPAGITYRIIRENIDTLDLDGSAVIKTGYSDTVKMLIADDLKQNFVESVEQQTGLASLYLSGEKPLSFDNILEITQKDGSISQIPNIGLLSNTVIPTLHDGNYAIVDNTVGLFGLDCIDGNSAVKLFGLDPDDSTRERSLRAKKPIKDL